MQGKKIGLAKQSRSFGRLSAFSLLVVLIGFLVYGWVNYFLAYSKEKEFDVAILPHFMIRSERVDQFYQYIKEVFYGDSDLPERIFLIGPNHFFPQEKRVQTICSPAQVWFKSQRIVLSSLGDFDLMGCSPSSGKNEIFFPFGESVMTKEHSIGEHFSYLTKYFPEVEVIPLVFPSYSRQGAFFANWILDKKGRNLVLVSVDFSHYLPEEIAISHDEESIAVLKKEDPSYEEFLALDVDCPACLFVAKKVAEEEGKKGNLFLRDSSSEIMGEELGEENTSRVFFWFE